MRTAMQAMADGLERAATRLREVAAEPSDARMVMQALELAGDLRELIAELTNMLRIGSLELGKARRRWSTP